VNYNNTEKSVYGGTRSKGDLVFIFKKFQIARIFLNGSSSSFRAQVSYSVPSSFFTDGRTPWTGDQPAARPLPTHRLNAHTDSHSFEWDSNPRS
jgi:hypothetical protein